MLFSLPTLRELSPAAAAADADDDDDDDDDDDSNSSSHDTCKRQTPAANALMKFGRRKPVHVETTMRRDSRQSSWGQASIHIPPKFIRCFKR